MSTAILASVTSTTRSSGKCNQSVRLALQSGQCNQSVRLMLSSLLADCAAHGASLKLQTYPYHLFFLKINVCCRVLVVMLIRIQLLSKYGSGSREPNLHKSMWIRILILVRIQSHKGLNFYLKIYLKYRSKNILTIYEGTKALVKGRKQGLFVCFGQFPSSWIRIRIHIRI
jgi:hypothetical protein